MTYATLLDPEQLRLGISIPDWFVQGFTPVLRANPKYRQRLVPAIVAAVQHSFNDSDTRMRSTPSADEIRRRFNAACGLLIKMYFERKLSLSQSLDILPGTLVDMIKFGQSASDAASRGTQGRWQPTGVDTTQMQQAEGDLLADGDVDGTSGDDDAAR